jgi:uncharacterized membrane protein
MYDLYGPIMICSKCSAEMPEISAYCPACGYPVNAASDPLRANDLTDKLLAAIAYVVPGVRLRPFVRFHAWQAVLFVAGTCVLAVIVRLLFLVFSVFPFGGFMFAWLLVGVGVIAISIMWAALVAKAALGHRYELPFIGPWAVRLAQ